MMEEDEIISISMKIILHAGNARNLINEALSSAKKFEFENANKKMKEADNEILLAHQVQTSVIQEEASGKPHSFSLLFTHAQDTLMTIISEFHLSKEMIDILKIIDESKGDKTC